MARVLRGEIYWADLDPVKGHEQAGRRPVLVISHDILNERSGTVIALALTSKSPKAGYPLTYGPLKQSRLAKLSWVKINQIRTISTERLGDRIAKVAEEEMQDVIEGLLELVG